MYSILVLQLGIAPDYVLDRMEFYEMETLMDNIHLRNKESWEQTRMIAYVTAQVNSTKQVDPKDLMTFPWEKEIEVARDSEEDIRKMMEEMKQIENKLNNR